VPSPDVLVVGAGPTGLFLACDLARRGLRPRVIDRLPAPSPLSKAIAIHARSLEILEDLGVIDDFLAGGQPLTRVRLHADGKIMVRASFEELDTHYPYALSIAQADTEAILAAKLAALGGTVERGQELSELEQDAAGVRATLKSGEVVRTPWLVGCDGAHSAVRKRAGLEFEGELFPQGFWLADVQAGWDLPTDEINTFCHATGLVACFPMPRDRRRLILSAPDGEDVQRTDAPSLTDFEALVRVGVPLSHPARPVRGIPEPAGGIRGAGGLPGGAVRRPRLSYPRRRCPRWRASTSSCSPP
jgi:2-polyprenyl-6-methoxyphenol hydroxylase-like FAD-dependent oxidoreductase